MTERKEVIYEEIKTERQMRGRETEKD